MAFTHFVDRFHNFFMNLHRFFPSVGRKTQRSLAAAPLRGEGSNALLRHKSHVWQ